MGIFGAMTTAVSGLRAQSYALENISGNIANSQTTGFKRVDTSFVDLIPEMPRGQELSGSVNATSRLTNTIQGSTQTTGVNTHMALNGEGYFVVQEQAGLSNNQPVFSGSDLYTRRGDFSLDKDGRLVNGAGLYLKGTPIDLSSGQETSGGNSILRISNQMLPARRSTNIELSGSFPTNPATIEAMNGIVNGALLREADFGNDPTTNNATAANRYVAANDEDRFLDRTIEGARVRVYNDVGAPLEVTMRLAKLSSAPSTWNAFYLEDEAAIGAAPKWRNVGVALTFDAAGQLTAPNPALITIPALTVNGAALGSSISLDLTRSGGMTETFSQEGLFRQSELRQDGNPTGALDSISVTSDGRITGNYSNGLVVALANISVAQFNADNMLKRVDGGAYEQTLESGAPIYGLNGSAVVGGSLEVSNTDIAEEFSKMIVTQQAYSANTRVVTTAQQMLADVINIIR